MSLVNTLLIFDTMCQLNPCLFYISRYCVSVFATDGTAEAEFVFFDKVAAGAVGKPLIALLRQRYPGRASVEDLASSARHDTADRKSVV